jgi:hypothetical protein
MSWKSEVMSDDFPWVGNGTFFATQAEAEAYAAYTAARWSIVTGSRAVEDVMPISHRYTDVLTDLNDVPAQDSEFDSDLWPGA